MATSRETFRFHCFVCTPDRPVDVGAYCYVFGQYLGDGHLVTAVRVPVLRIYACTDYPDITELIFRSITAVRGRRPGRFRAGRDRVDTVQSYWMHWPCLLPQHGPGRKHERPIVPAEWQRALIEAEPWPFLRGLIHSDGCRATNTLWRRGRSYSYPRYFFSNESRDILALAGWTLGLVGARWRYNRPNCISVARRESVALLDEHIGPKS